RDGFGDVLAEGSRRLAERFARAEVAMHVKGMEIPAYDPRGMPAQALGYMTSPTGACHLRGGYSIALAFFGGYKEVPRFSIRQAAMTAKNQQDLGIIQDSFGVCRFTGYAVGAEYWTKAYSAVTGNHVSREEIEESAERIATLERVFNVKTGITRKDDDLPARFKTQSISIGDRSYRISENDRERMLDDYYEIRGWDKDGVPERETCEKYGIEL
ncbi:MAG TPA: aldehyde ferredoxin oxidoreductase C-terminal domain-containing protein, partial [bacterium]|nr:aldehyde ferredoxin oxidoreductase C-terminal domain-containing protein [bacterium]